MPAGEGDDHGHHHPETLAELVGELLGIERPALDEGSVAAEAHEGRELVILLRQADLEVMPRHRFVQVQRLHAPGVAHRQVVGVVEKYAGPRSVGGALDIAACGIALGAVVGHRADLERGLGDQRELLAHAQVHPLADRLIALAQRVCALGLEARVGAQEGEEFGQGTGETDRLLLRLHLAQDTLHFGQSQIVDIIRGQRQRRVALDRVVVHRRAARQRRGADAVARRGQILLHQEIAHLRVRRDDHVLDLRGIGGTQPCLIGLANPLRELLDRRIEDRSFDALRDQLVELADHVAHDQLGLDDLALHPFAKQRDHPVIGRRIFNVAFEVVVVVGNVLERCRPLPRREIRVEGLEAGEMVHRQIFADAHDRGREALKSTFLIGLEHVIGDLVDRTQPGPIDALERGEIPLGCRLLRCGKGIGIIVTEPVGVTHVTAEDRHQRLALEHRLVAGVEQCPELGILCALTRLGCRRLLRRCRSGENGAAGKQAGEH